YATHPPTKRKLFQKGCGGGGSLWITGIPAGPELSTELSSPGGLSAGCRGQDRGRRIRPASRTPAPDVEKAGMARVLTGFPVRPRKSVHSPHPAGIDAAAAVSDR